MSETDNDECFEVRFPKTTTIVPKIRLFTGLESQFANCFFGSERAYIVVADPLPDADPGEDAEITYRRIFEEDRPVIQLLQFGDFRAKRAIEFNGPDGQPVRIVDFRDDETFELMAGQFNKIAVSPPVFRFRDAVNNAIQASIFSDVKHTSQERLQVERSISYYNDTVSKEESPYPNRFKDDPDVLREGVIPDTPATLVDYLLETMYCRETFNPNYLMAAIKKLLRLTGVAQLDIERLYHYPPGKNASLACITFLGRYSTFGHKVLTDALTRPPEQRFCELDAMKIAAEEKMSRGSKRQLPD